MRPRILPTLAILLLAGCHTAPAPLPATALAPSTGLISPWDATPVAATTAPYACAPAPAIGPDLTVTADIDSDNTQLSDDVKNAVYGESSSALHDLTTRVVAAADNYRNTGNISAASCAAGLLTEVAQHGGMTGHIANTPAWDQHSLALRSYAIAWLKIRPSGIITPAQQATVLPWMDDLSRMERSYYEHHDCGERTCDLHGHRGHSAAAAAAAVGIAANDRSQFHWAISEYHSAVGSLTSAGHVHYDMKGSYALIFNLESAANLVQIAELAEFNNEPLYGYDNGRIHVLVHDVTMGLVDPTPFKLNNRSKSTQKHYLPIQPWEVAWASVYNRRFPDPVITGLLRQVGPSGADMWGGQPWDPQGDPTD